MERRRLGLALSGGGFRATLFHLGVIKFLRDAGLLTDTRRITSVSGGSVLAAHLVLNWEKYTGDEAAFDAVSKELVDFTMSDVRGRVLRSWMMSWITVLPRLFTRNSGRWKLTSLLQRQYGKLLDGAKLGDLPRWPALQIMCTSMTTGEPCCFDRNGITFFRESGPEPITTTTLELALAVAASSAFPPLFPPLRVDNDILICSYTDLPIAEFLTDGGVFDNLGIERLLASQASSEDLDLMIISDAGGNFDWSPTDSYTSFLSRNIRASDMLMRRVSLFQSGFIWESRDDVRRVHIGSVVSNDVDPTVTDPGTQRALHNVRTDLDRFSAREVAALISHGYAVARQTLADPNYSEGSPTFSWPALDKHVGRQNRHWSKENEAVSRSRTYPLFRLTEATTWVSILALATYFLVALSLFVVYPSFQIHDLREQNQKLASGPSAYIRNNHEKSVVVFVHGVFGDARETWSCGQTHTNWPQLLTEYPALSKIDIYSVGYPSSISGSGVTFADLAEIVYGTLEYEGIFQNHEHVVFVAHDAGGLLIQKMLTAHQSAVPKVAAIVNYGVPFSGAAISKVVNLFSKESFAQNHGEFSRNTVNSVGVAKFSSCYQDVLRVRNSSSGGNSCGEPSGGNSCLQSAATRSKCRSCRHGEAMRYQQPLLSALEGSPFSDLK